MTDADLQRIADELGEPIEIVREMSDAIACCADEGNVEARVERRSAAREAYHDELSGDGIEAGTDPVDVFAEALDTAIETATRVRVDDAIIEAARDNSTDPDGAVDRAAIEAAFRAAGFEVEK